MIIDKEFMKTYNMNQILKIIWENEGITKFEISKLCGLTAAGVGKIVSGLIEDKYVEEREFQHKSSSRIVNGLYIDCKNRYNIVIYCTNKDVMLGVLDYRGRIHAKEKHLIDYRKSNEENYEKFFQAIKSNIEYVLSKNRIIDNIVFVINGKVLDNKIIDKVYGGKLYYNELILRVEKELHNQVEVVESGDSYIAGEIIYGNSEMKQSIYYLDIKDEVTYSMYFNRMFYHGYNNGAGSLNHIQVERKGIICSCGKTGCLSASLSWEGILSRYTFNLKENDEFSQDHLEEIAIGDISWDDIYERAMLGEKSALLTVKETGRIIGRGISKVVDYFNPEIIYVSGLYSANNIMNIEINRELNKHSNHKNLQGVYIGEPKVKKNKELKGGIAFLILKRYTCIK